MSGDSSDELLGRVVSAVRLFGTGVAALSALVGGAIATAYGLPAPMYVAASVLVIAGIAIRPRRPGSTT